jgi:hypothetical protein
MEVRFNDVSISHRRLVPPARDAHQVGINPTQG